MPVSKPGGRFGKPVTSTPGKEKKARSDSGYQSGVVVGFGVTGAGGMDNTPVKPKAAVQVQKDSMPSVNGNKGFQ